jgi:hypothetical protein
VHRRGGAGRGRPHHRHPHRRGHGPAAIWISTIREHFIPRVAARVERETPHRIRWTEAFGGAVCRPGDCLEAVETGLLDVGDIQVVFEPSKLIAHNFALYAPFGPNDPRMAAKLAREVYERVPRLKGVLERQFKQVYLAAGCTGSYGLVTVHPLAAARRPARAEDRRGGAPTWPGCRRPASAWFPSRAT